MEFQFLIGRLKTCQDEQCIQPFLSFNSLQVGSKHDLSDVDTTGIAKFQFLIGRLKTKYRLVATTAHLCFNSLQVGSKPIDGWEPSEACYMFQFLIGRLKTKPKCDKLKVVSEFQFLIGRLKTQDSTLSGWTTTSFNSLQVGSKHDNLQLGNEVVTKFQFLIGRLKTHFRLFIASCRSRPNCQNSSLIHFPLARFY